MVLKCHEYDVADGRQVLPDTKHNALKAATIAFVPTAPDNSSIPLARVSAKGSLTLPWPVYKPRPVIDDRTIAKLERLPQAAKATELSERACTFTSSGRNIFVHYVEPVLNCRRAALHSSGLTKKKWFKTAAQLWQTMKERQHEEYIFWCQQASELQNDLRTKTLSHEDCLKYAGRAGDAQMCVLHAQIAVSHYLDIALPLELEQESFVKNVEDAASPNICRMAQGENEADGATITTPLQAIHIATDSKEPGFPPSCEAPGPADTAPPYGTNPTPPAKACDGDTQVSPSACDIKPTQ